MVHARNSAYYAGIIWYANNAKNHTDKIDAGHIHMYLMVNTVNSLYLQM